MISEPLVVVLIRRDATLSAILHQSMSALGGKADIAARPSRCNSLPRTGAPFAFGPDGNQSVQTTTLSRYVEQRRRQKIGFANLAPKKGLSALNGGTPAKPFRWIINGLARTAITLNQRVQGSSPCTPTNSSMKTIAKTKAGNVVATASNL